LERFLHPEKQSEPKESTEPSKIIDSREEHFQKHLSGIILRSPENVIIFNFEHSEKPSKPKDSIEPRKVFDSYYLKIGS
jgi:hypothetical protein